MTTTTVLRDHAQQAAGSVADMLAAINDDRFAVADEARATQARGVTHGRHRED